MTDCGICTAKTLTPVDMIVYEDDHWRLRHATETNILGYLVLESKRHFLDLAQASADECATYGTTLALAMKVIRQVVKPARIYTFSLAEAVPHFHVHLIPRTDALPRAYRGRGIMSYPLAPVASPTLTRETCARLKAAIKRLSSGDRHKVRASHKV